LLTIATDLDKKPDSPAPAIRQAVCLERNTTSIPPDITFRNWTPSNCFGRSGTFG
jgi:hypothetical protein